VSFPVPREDRYFEDYVPGSVHDCGETAASEDEIIEFASRFDPQSFHVDPALAADGPFGGLIASGWHTASLVMRLLTDHYLSTVSSLGSPGVDELRWLKPVRPNVSLRLRVTVVDARLSRSKPDRGLVTARAELTDPDGDLVFRATLLNFVRVRAQLTTS
jgi:acyl dehydratase